jgi:cytochrome P450
VAERPPSDYSLVSEETLECPYPFYAAMRREDPVHRVEGEDVFLVSRWEDIVHVSGRPEHFSATRAPADALAARLAFDPANGPRAEGEFSDAGLSNCDGAEHHLKRSLALALVSPTRLRSFTPRMRVIVDELIDGFAARGEAEFASEFSTPLPLRVTCELLGVRLERELFSRMMQQVPASAVRFIDADAREERRRVGEAMHEFMRGEILAHLEHPRADFLSEFVHAHAQRADVLPLEYLIGEATTLLFGGLVTTQHMFTNTLQLLLENPEQLARVLADRSLVRPMLEESLRLESPFHLTEQRCLVDAEVGGVPIPAGAAVYKVWGSGNRDEDKFDAPDSFRVGRSGLAKAHLGFGRGSHRCLGAPLALLEGVLAFERLLERCHNLRFAPGRNDWTHVHQLSFRSLRELHIRFDPE